MPNQTAATDIPEQTLLRVFANSGLSRMGWTFTRAMETSYIRTSIINAARARLKAAAVLTENRVAFRNSRKARLTGQPQLF